MRWNTCIVSPHSKSSRHNVAGRVAYSKVLGRCRVQGTFTSTATFCALQTCSVHAHWHIVSVSTFSILTWSTSYLPSLPCASQQVRRIQIYLQRVRNARTLDNADSLLCDVTGICPSVVLILSYCGHLYFHRPCVLRDTVGRSGDITGRYCLDSESRGN